MAATLLDRIERERRAQVRAREKFDGQDRARTRRLAVLIAETRLDPDPKVNPTSAAERMGVTKGYTHALLRKLDAGLLD